WAVAEGSVVTVNWVAVPAVSVTVAELTPVSPVAEKLRVRSPAAPVIARLVNVAAPVQIGRASCRERGVPPAVALASVNVTAYYYAGLRIGSGTVITGWWGERTPFWAVAEGSVVTVNWVAVPAVSVTVAELTPVSPVAEKLRVRSPAAPVIARLVNVAAPV